MKKEFSIFLYIEKDGKSVLIYKSILINYCDKYKKSLALALSRALGYTIAKDLMLGNYTMNMDCSITGVNTLACRTAIMIIASYYSWQIMNDSGASHKIRNIPSLDKSAKMAMQMFILGGLDKEDIDNGELTRYLYLLCNYVTLNYVITGNKVNIRSMFSEGTVAYQKLSVGIYNSNVKEMAIQALENLVNVCITLIEKCKTSLRLENVDIEPVYRLVRDTEYQLTKTLDNDKLEQLHRENSPSKENMKKIIDLVLNVSATKPNLPMNVLNLKHKEK